MPSAIVVGAGPAGVLTSVYLAQLGYDVEVSMEDLPVFEGKHLNARGWLRCRGAEAGRTTPALSSCSIRVGGRLYTCMRPARRRVWPNGFGGGG